MRRRLCFAVQYQTSKNELTAVDDLIDWNSKKSKWFFSQRFGYLRVAHYWQLTPTQWDDTSEDCKAEMIAYYNLENKIANYEDVLRERRNWKK